MTLFATINGAAKPGIEWTSLRQQLVDVVVELLVVGSVQFAVMLGVVFEHLEQNFRLYIAAFQAAMMARKWVAAP